MSAFGRLYGVGIGPGDPDLLTVKATKVIAASPVVAYLRQGGTARQRARDRRLLAEAVACRVAALLPDDQ